MVKKKPKPKKYLKGMPLGFGTRASHVPAPPPDPKMPKSFGTRKVLGP